MNGLLMRDRGQMDPARLFLTFWLVIVVSLTLFYRLETAPMPYHYDFGTCSADVATMARSFVNHGVLALGGVPINNNPPLGLSPSAYTHWPPLLPIILSACFRIFGESEATAHGLMLVVVLASASLLFWIADLCLGRTAAFLAAFCWLTLPTVVHWGHVLLQESLAVLFILAALLAFLKATDSAEIQWAWAVPGGIAVALAAWSSWESVLLSPGLLAAALWSRRPSQQRLALIYASLALMATVTLVAWYAIRYPGLMADTWQTAKFRMGLASTYSNELLHRYSGEARMSLPGMIFNLARLHWHELGLLGLSATAWVILTGLEARACRKGSALVLAFCGLLAPWLLWCVLMPNHVANHNFETLIAAPAVAMALAWGGREALHVLSRSPQARLGLGSLVVLLIVPALMLEPLGEVVWNNLEWHRGMGWRGLLPSVKLPPHSIEPDPSMRFADEIREIAGPDAVILTPVPGMVHVYYSRRHFIRAITDDDLLDRAIPQAAAAFPGSPLYLALRAAERPSFPKALARYSAVRVSPNLILLALEQRQASRGNVPTEIMFSPK